MKERERETHTEKGPCLSVIYEEFHVETETELCVCLSEKITMKGISSLRIIKMYTNVQGLIPNDV